MLNQVSASQINIGKLDVIPTEDSSSFNIELSSIYNQAETKMKENINNNNINSKIVSSPESAFLISKISPNRSTNISSTVDNSPTRQSSLIYSYKLGNNSNVSIQTGKASTISANGIITKSKPTLLINKKPIMNSPTSVLSVEIESNEPLLTNMSKDAYSTFSFQTLDSNVNTFITSAPNSRICGKTEKLDHILELACTIMGDEDIRYQDSSKDINSSACSLSEDKTNQTFKIDLPPLDEDKKKMMEELVVRMFDNIDDEILEKEFKELKLTEDSINKVKSLNVLSIGHKTENNIQSTEREKRKENGNDLDNEYELDSGDNSKYIDAIESKEGLTRENFDNNDYLIDRDFKKIKLDIQSDVEFDEQEMLKFLKINKDRFSDRNTFDKNNVLYDEISEENCMRKDSNEDINEHGKHPQWFKRMRNYFHGEGLKIKK